MAERINELKKSKNRKWRIQKFNQLIFSVKMAFFAVLMAKCLDVETARMDYIFLITFIMIFLCAKLTSLITGYPKYQSQEFHNNIEEMLVATKNAGLELIRVEDNLYSFKLEEMIWSSNAPVQILDQGNACKIIATPLIMECLKEHFLLEKLSNKSL